jgi:Protein of unknown function (DUF3800)
VYLLYLDESGTHGGSPVFILAGLALHEQDTWFMQRRLDDMLKRKLPKGLNLLDFELHAADIKSPKAPVPGKRKRASEWLGMPYGTRLDILNATYRSLARFKCRDTAYPCAFFGAVVDRSYADYEERAYELVLHKFDEMLTRQAHDSGVHQRGIVIHDKRVVEKDVQRWAATWRQVAGRIGRLAHLSDVPFFADSRASRCIQAADFVSWALWRYYGLPTPDESFISPLWSHFDEAGGKMHGLIHVVPGFRQGVCSCPPCSSRAAAA